MICLCEVKYFFKFKLGECDYFLCVHKGKKNLWVIKDEIGDLIQIYREILIF